MKTENYGEQPEVQNEENNFINKDEVVNFTDGSLGKFKDAESLLNAYNNLQAEFTKKCQKLSALEKENNKIVYTEEDWNKRVANFLEKNPEAKNYSKEISETILNNGDLKNKENALEIAWSSIAMKKYIGPEKLVNDKDFLNTYIFNNEEIKKQIIQKYIHEIQSAPQVISGSSGANFSPKENFTPQNLTDAKKYVEKFFK